MRLVPDGPDQPPESGGLESPSLFADVGDGPVAYEQKFLLDEDRARAVETFAKRSLGLDRHADPTRGNSYPTTSLYTDTSEYDVYRRTEAAGGCKFRVRRYGAEGPMFVEQKIKFGDRVRKRRAPVKLSELAAVGRGAAPPEWPGIWFRDGVAEQKLSPVCRIAYDRVAYLGVAEGGTVRITFDRNVRGTRTDRWDVERVGNSPMLLEGQVICEFKFRLALPALFKVIIGELGLAPSTVSKYRRFMQTTLAAENEGHADAR